MGKKKQNTKRGGRQGSSWVGTVAFVYRSSAEDFYSCCAIRRKTLPLIWGQLAGAASWSDTGRHESLWMWANCRPPMQKPHHQVLTLKEDRLWASPKWPARKMFCAWKTFSEQPIMFKKKKSTELKRSCILHRKIVLKKKDRTNTWGCFLCEGGEKSCQHFRNKWLWPLEPGRVNPRFSKVTTSLEALVQLSEPRPRVMRALKHLSKHYSSCRRLWELPLQNSKFSHVNRNAERPHEITQWPNRVTPSFSSALQQTSSKLSCVLRLILVSAHSRAK